MDVLLAYIAMKTDAGIRTMPMVEMEKEKESSISLYYTAPSLTDHIILILGLPTLLIMILWYC